MSEERSDDLSVHVTGAAVSLLVAALIGVVGFGLFVALAMCAPTSTTEVRVTVLLLIWSLAIAPAVTGGLLHERGGNDRPWLGVTVGILVAGAVLAALVRAPSGC